MVIKFQKVCFQTLHFVQIKTRLSPISVISLFGDLAYAFHLYDGECNMKHLLVVVWMLKDLVLQNDCFPDIIYLRLPYEFVID